MNPRLLLPVKDIAAVHGKEILDHARNVVKRYGISTGYDSVDSFLRGGGLLPGLLYVVGGRPGIGKSQFILNLALNISKQNKPVAVFSLELSKERVLERLAYMEAGIDYMQHWQASQPLSEQDIKKLVESIKKLQSLPIYIRDTVRLSPGAIRKNLEDEKDLGVEVAFIDYLHILGSDRAIWNREREIGTGIETIRDHAKSLGIAIVLASQLNREVEQAEPYIPSLHNFRDSGAIEQVAFNVIALYRKDYYTLAGMFAEEQMIDGRMSILMLKNQDGPTGTISLKFDGATGRISE